MTAPTIRVHARSGMLGHAETITSVVPWSGQTIAEVVDSVRRPEWDGIPLGVAVDGELVPEGSDLTLPVGVDVVVGPQIEGDFGKIVKFIFALPTVIAEFVMDSLSPKPIATDLALERGDAASPTYHWAGIQSGSGQGAILGIGWGEHDLGGHIIYTSVSTSTVTGTLSEEITTILSLPRGPIHSIGGISGEADALDGSPGKLIPANIRVNQNALDPFSSTPGATVWLRPGTLRQSPLPSPFTGASTTFAVNARVDAPGEAIFTFTATEEIASCAILLVFPGGLYQQDSQGNVSAYPVSFLFDWRLQGARTGWIRFDNFNGQPLGTIVLGTTASQSFLSLTQGAFFPQNLTGNPTGPIEVRVRRTTPAGGQSPGVSIVDSGQWRQIVVNQPGLFAYPEEPLVGLQIQASEKISGGSVQYLVRAKLRKVKVWDPVHGFSALLWEVPSEPPFRFMTYPPGQNPAWILLDFLTYIGIPVTDIDLLSLRQWSVYCDQEPGPSGSEWSEPRFQFDGVVDRSRPAMETILMICQAGRAAPVFRGAEISIVYSFAAVHADQGPDGYLVIGAKAPVQLFSDANASDVQVDYLPRRHRPTLIEMPFLNRDKSYAQDVFPVEETESFLGIEDVVERPEDYRREVIQSYGVTRPSQLYREGIWLHRLRRKTLKRLRFTAGPWAIACVPGDLISFQHDVLRPFPSTPVGLTVAAGGSATTTVVIDRPVTIAPATTYHLLMRGPLGEVIDATVTNSPGTTATITVSAAVSVNAGAAAAFGIEDEITQDYLVVEITLDGTMRRKVTAMSWDPSVYIEPDADTGGFGAPAVEVQVPEQSDAQNAPLVVDPDDIRITPEQGRPGVHRIHWGTPVGRARHSTRVYVRPDASASWFALGEVRSEDHGILWEGFGVGQSWQVVVSIADDSGTYGLPDALAPATVTVDEFPRLTPPNVSNVVATATADGFAVSWDTLDNTDLAYFEARRGTFWEGATLVYRGLLPRFDYRDPPHASATLLVAARTRSGLYSGKPVAITLPAFAPEGTAQVGSTVDEVPPTLTLPTVLEYSAGEGAIRIIEHTDGNRGGGPYTLPALDAGSVRRLWWSVATEVEFRDGATVDDWDFEIDSGEARWRTVNARGPSSAAPGVDWSRTVDDLAMPIDALPRSLTVAGDFGEPGAAWFLDLEARYHDGASWGSWGPFVAGWRTAQQIQVRVSLWREQIAADVLLSVLEVKAYAKLPEHEVSFGAYAEITSADSPYAHVRTVSTIYVDCDGDVEIDLLPAATAAGDVLRIKRRDTVPSDNELLIDPDGSEEIDDEASRTLLDGEALTLHSDGSTWGIL